MRYMTASITPQAKLQPRAARSMVRTSTRPDSAALNEAVKVNTMTKPNNTPDMRSIGSRTPLELLLMVLAEPFPIRQSVVDDIPSFVGIESRNAPRDGVGVWAEVL